MYNWVDIIIIAFLFLFALEAVGRNFIIETVDFLSFLVAFFSALSFYNIAASFIQQNFQLPHSLSNVLGFISVWFFVEVILFLTVQLLLGRLSGFIQLDRRINFFSVIPAFLRGLIFMAIMLVFIGTFPIQPTLKQAVNKSVVGSRILVAAQNLEGPLKNVFGGITQDTLTFLTIKPKSGESVNLGFQTTEFTPNPILEQEMIRLVNMERGKRGLETLEYDPSLTPIGRNHSADMFTRGYFSHYTPEGKSVADRAEDAGVEYLVIGENLAYAPTLELAHNGLMNSPGHRANILSEDFGKIAIGIMDGGAYGLMITQQFTNE